MTANIDYLGKWPVDGKKARKEKKLIVIHPEDHLQLIQGKEQHVLVSMIVSNDYINVGLMTIPVGGRSELEVHEGDETLCVLGGTLDIRTLGPGEADKVEEEASHMSYRVEQGEKMLIPEGIRHQYLNFTNEPIKIFVAVGPKL